MTMIPSAMRPSPSPARGRSDLFPLVAFVGLAFLRSAFVGLALVVLAAALGACSSSPAVSGNGGNTGLGGAGHAGTGGVQGTGGNGGAAGAAGTPGIAGATGAAGAAGTTGTAGTQGTAGATAGSTGTAGKGGAGGTSGRVPLKHRAVAVACAMDRSASVCAAASMPEAGVVLTCTRDADCVTGANGRCDPMMRGLGCACSYDQCFADADCTTTGGPCECRPPAIMAAGGQSIAAPAPTPTNACKQGNCRVDGDCGGSYCSPSLGTCGNYGGLFGYYCHTPKDKCTDDADCAAQGGGDCRFNQVSAAWECQTSQCAG